MILNHSLSATPNGTTPAASPHRHRRHVDHGKSTLVGPLAA